MQCHFVQWNFTGLLKERTASISRVKCKPNKKERGICSKQVSDCCQLHAEFLVDLLFNPEDGDMS
jgi:hypothetical protein